MPTPAAPCKAGVEEVRNREEKVVSGCYYINKEGREREGIREETGYRRKK